MFVFLSKLLPPLVYPLGLACILILLGIFLRKWKSWQWTVLILAFFILFLGGNRWVAYTLTRSLEWQNLPSDNIPTTDAIVLLGGGTESPDYPRPMVEINGAGDRVIYAAKLFKDGKASHILVSGGRPWMYKTHLDSPSEDMRSLLLLMGVPDQAIWLQGSSQNTYEDALYCRQILEAKGIHRITLVTSAAHMPRASGVFRKQGLEVVPAAVDFKVTQEMWESLASDDLPTQLIGFMPSVTNLGMTTNAIKEYIGILVYHWQGWV